MNSFGHCEKLTSNALIVFKERQSRIIFRNTRRALIRRITIDGCVITHGPRCDYLLINSHTTEYYIELKGCNLRRALDQIEATIQQVSSNPIRAMKHSLIISTRCPLFSPEIQANTLRFRRDYNSSLIIRTIKYEVDI